MKIDTRRRMRLRKLEKKPLKSLRNKMLREKTLKLNSKLLMLDKKVELTSAN